MKKCSKCNELKELNSFYKHKLSKDGLKSRCKICYNLIVKKWQQNNKEKLKEYENKYYINNKSKKKQHRLNWIRNNPKALIILMKKYREKDLNKFKERERNYIKNNRGKVNAKRRSKKLQCTPKWLTKDQLNEIIIFYIKTKELEILLNKRFDVDHIIPLQGKNVCGLHVPWNLQILLKSVNCKKSNKF